MREQFFTKSLLVVLNFLMSLISRISTTRLISIVSKPISIVVVVVVFVVVAFVQIS